MSVPFSRRLTATPPTTTISEKIEENIFIQSGCLLPLFRANNKCRFHVRSSAFAHTYKQTDKCSASNMKRARHIRYRRRRRHRCRRRHHPSCSVTREYVILCVSFF